MAATVWFYDGDLAALATRLRGEYDHVWLVGGATLARSFLQEGLVDDLRLTVAPAVLGAGVPLFDETVGLADVPAAHEAIRAGEHHGMAILEP